ncbi:universal stress protein [Hwanghaeella sp.]|uniref:universal stress protein n=1 Tax=Hwanghaeella sp. TaxID=2605943 RepID=UPI003CCBD005
MTQMDSDNAGRPSSGGGNGAPGPERVFLVVVDESEEMPVALKFACKRAKKTGGRVALLHVVQPTEFVHWLGVETLMREESREQGEALLQKYAAEVNRSTGEPAILIVREGDEAQQVAAVLKEDKTISILVLAASTSSEGPGPVVSHLTGKELSNLRIPITIVPGCLSDDELDAIT